MKAVGGWPLLQGQAALEALERSGVGTYVDTSGHRWVRAPEVAGPGIEGSAFSAKAVDGNSVIDPNEPVVVHASEQAPAAREAAIARLLEEGFPFAEDPQTGATLVDPTGKPYLRIPTEVPPGIEGMAYGGTTTVDGVEVIDPGQGVFVQEATGEGASVEPAAEEDEARDQVEAAGPRPGETRIAQPPAPIDVFEEFGQAASEGIGVPAEVPWPGCDAETRRALEDSLVREGSTAIPAPCVLTLLAPATDPESGAPIPKENLERPVTIDEGGVLIDPGTERWRITEVEGHLWITRLEASGDGEKATWQPRASWAPAVDPSIGGAGLRVARVWTEEQEIRVDTEAR